MQRRVLEKAALVGVMCVVCCLGVCAVQQYTALAIDYNARLLEVHLDRPTGVGVRLPKHT